MKKTRLKKVFIIPLLLLSIILSTSAAAFAAEPSKDIEPRASMFISSYSGASYALSGGRIKVQFDAVGTGTMDRVGAGQVVIQQSSNNSTWTSVKTYHYTKYPSMTDTNCASHASSVTYYGTVGRYYRAVITIYAEKDGMSDSRLKTTGSVKAIK